MAPPASTATIPPDLAAAYIVRKYLRRFGLRVRVARYDWYTWGRRDVRYCVGTDPKPMLAC